MKDFEQEYNIALSIAQSAHQCQLDKGGNPYILHPIRVSMKCNTNEAKIAALLHDVIEDSPMTLNHLREKMISEEIIEAVDVLTKRNNESYEDYIKRIYKNKIAKEVKIADLEDNMDLTRLESITDKDVKRIRKYHLYWSILKEN